MGLLDRGLTLLLAIAADGGRRSLSELAAAIGVPNSSARRMAMLLLERGLVVKLEPGRYAAGRAFLDFPSACRVVAGIAFQPMRKLALETGATLHLGLLEDEMVTYIAKVEVGAPAVLTRAGSQLEAYSSAIGRVLLSLQPDRVIRSYLASGPFVALTRSTEIDPDRLGRTLAAIRAEGYAVEQEETQEGVYCTAVPVPDARGAELPPSIRRLALSITRIRSEAMTADLIDADRKRLEACATDIGARLRAIPHAPTASS